MVTDTDFDNMGYQAQDVYSLRNQYGEPTILNWGMQRYVGGF